MNDFDFDALRDPDAPFPGAQQRARVNARARQLRVRALRNRFAAGAASILVLVLIAVGVVANTGGKAPSVTVSGTSSTGPATTSTRPGSAVDGRFVPPTSIKNGKVVLPVTFPDGETTTLRYPTAMRIAELGFAGGAGVSYPVSSGALHCCGKVLSVRYTTAAHVYGNAQPVRVYRGANGEAVDYFHASQAVDPPNATKQDYLAFQFGPWLVQVYDVQHDGDFEQRMTDAQRATWARSLTGTLDANGYLVLHAQPPLSIDHGSESGFGAEPGNRVELDPHLYCDQPESDTAARRLDISGGTHGVSWCEGKDLHVSASGSANFAGLAYDGLQVSRLAPPTTGPVSTAVTTTTTTAPVSAPNAVSATFVSPKHGWVLRRTGAVAETRDGGASWSEVGSLASAGLAGGYSTPQIRFANSARGFVHTGNDLYTTGDGGAHWQKAAHPFGSIQDLAVSHGVVYVVAFDDSRTNFGLWSSPSDALAWSKDALTLPTGAGPVPVQQFVFSGSRGWVTNGDRGIMGGARLTTSGRWETWKPPCLGAYAWLAASTGTDLVASCEEGVWTGPKITDAVYFSHDGGATWQRATEPIFGAVASPGPDTAVVVDGDNVQRTVDGGATWKSVAGVTNPNANMPSDLGFTTATQGFVIFTNGPMLMTYDAGATWSSVTLP
ncbi:MAG: hypothetical protein QOI08_3614 [Actinomycetota bacterium]|nr:hypothetical protein [Actinomycetota bacterium]